MLNDAVGGINPAAVEVALRSGGMWVGFPTVSSRVFQARLGPVSPRMQVPLGIGARELSVLGAGGALRPEALTTLGLAAAANAVVHLGYLTFAETALARAAADAGITRMVITNLRGAPPSLTPSSPTTDCAWSSPHTGCGARCAQVRPDSSRAMLASCSPVYPTIARS